MMLKKFVVFSGDKENKMNVFNSAPRTMTVLLGITVIWGLAQTSLFAPSRIALLLPILEITVVISALSGNRRAAIVFKHFSYILCIALPLSLFAPRPMTVFLVCRRLASAVLYFVVARYLDQSVEVARYYNEKIIVANDGVLSK